MHFGMTLTASDIDGDGMADLLVGAPYSRGMHFAVNVQLLSI